jgi:predicted nucleic acid-binding protein
MIVVSNAGPLIVLAKIGRFDLLQSIFGRLIIPQAVYDEVAIAGAGRPGADETRQACDAWIEIMPIHLRQTPR